MTGNFRSSACSTDFSETWSVLALGQHRQIPEIRGSGMGGARSALLLYSFIISKK